MRLIPAQVQVADDVAVRLKVLIEILFCSQNK